MINKASKKLDKKCIISIRNEFRTVRDSTTIGMDFAVAYISVLNDRK